MKIVYITAAAPFGKGEMFINNEMLEIANHVDKLYIYPRDNNATIFHPEVKKLIKNVSSFPLFSLSYLKKITLDKANIKLILYIIMSSSKLKQKIKNVFVIPKAFYLAEIIKKNDVDHIHVHWGTTTATIGLIISKLTGISWSFTLHRWDIYDNNMLLEKVKSASFVRCISDKGRRDLITLIRTKKYCRKIKVLHVGVPIDKDFNKQQNLLYNCKKKNNFILAVPANLLPVKGHKYLIDAVAQLVSSNIKNFHLFFFGDGYLKKRLQCLINRKGIQDFVSIVGMIPHEELIRKYRNGKVDVVILPSICITKNEHEGIPVSLIEAMNYSIPVISTDTGSIHELLSNNCGFLVKEKESRDLAYAIKKILQNMRFLSFIANNGYHKVTSEYNLDSIARELVSLFSNKSPTNLVL